MNGEITRDELSTDLDQELVFDTDKVKSLVDIEIKGRTLVNLLGRAGNAIYKQSQHFNCSLNATIGFDAECITLTNNETVQAGKILALTAYKGRAEVGKYYLFACEKVAGTIGQVAFYGCSLLSYSWNEDNVCYGLYKFNGVESGGSSHIDMVFGGMQPSETASIKNVRLYEISEVEAQSIINHDKGASTPAEVAERYPYVDDVKCVVNPYLENKENLLEGILARSGGFGPDGSLNDSSDGYDSLSIISSIPVKKGEIYSLLVEGEYAGQFVPSIFIYKPHATEFVQGHHQLEAGSKSTTITILGDGFLNLYSDRQIHGYANKDDVLDSINSGKTKFTLAKGSIPKSYEDCHNSRIMFETKLYDGETITRRNDGAYVKNSEWEELDLTNCLPAYNCKETGVHMVYFGIDNEGIVSKTRPLELAKVIKFDGTILGQALGDSPLNWSADECFYYSSGFGEIYRLTLTIPNSLTGWGDDYSPTTDEIKAFFLGWRMSQKNTGGQPYNNTGEKEWTKLWCGIGTAVSYGGALCVNSSNVEALPTTMNDQGYTPYRLVYKRETPIIEEVKTYGELVTKDSTDVLASSGLVLGERFKPVHNGTQYVFNTNNLSNGARGNNRIDSIVKVLDGDAFVQYFEQIDNGIRNGKSQCKLIDFDGQSVYANYLIYSPDTVTSFEYSLKEVKTIKEVLSKSQDEIANCFEELARTKRHLRRAEEDLRQRSNPNLLINGDFQVWQRGTSFTWNSGAKYCADRFIFVVNTETTVSKTDEGMSIKVPSGAWYCRQILEKPLKAGAYTVSVSVDGKVHSYQLTSTGSTKLITVMDANSAYCKGAGATHIINWIKLELGEHATPFVPRSYGEELALCQRYYYEFSNDKYSHVAFIKFVRGYGWGVIPLPTNMRAMPTPIIEDDSTLYLDISNVSTYIAKSNFSILNYGNCNGLSYSISGVSADMDFPGMLVKMHSKKFALDAEIY